MIVGISRKDRSGLEKFGRGCCHSCWTAKMPGGITPTYILTIWVSATVQGMVFRPSILEHGD